MKIIFLPSYKKMAQRPQAPSAGFEFSIGKAEQAFSWSSEEGFKPKSSHSNGYIK